jgi:pilus assembly protein CpaC
MVLSWGGRKERGRKLWAVALCGGSFLAGQLAWSEEQGPGARGQEPEAKAGSLLGDYLQSASQITAELSAGVGSQGAGAGVTLVEARPLPVSEARPLTAKELQPLTVKQAVVQEAPDFKNPVAPASNEEHLAPIVPAWAMPKKPGDRGKESGARSQGPGAKGQGPGAGAPSPIPNPQSQIQNPYIGQREPLKMEVGARSPEPGAGSSSQKSEVGGQKSEVRGQQPVASGQEARAAEGRVLSTQYLAPSVTPQPAEPKTGIQNSEKAEPVVTAQTEAGEPAALRTPSSALRAEPALRTESPLRTAEFEARLLAQPAKETDAFRKATANKEDEFGKLPEGSPFEAIPQSGNVKLRVRRSVLLRTKVDIYRTAIVDQSVCDIVQFTPREVSIIGRSVGQTHVTFWFDDPNMAPLTYLVEVKADAEQVKADEDKYQLLENVINEMFPDSKIHLVIVADKLLVKGQAKDSEEAAQIMNIVRAQGVRGGYGGGGVGGYGGAYGGVADAMATPVLSQAATGGNPGPGYQIINMLRVPGVQQVALKVKIADLNRTAARGFGIDVFGTVNLSDSINGSKLFLASLLNASATGGTALITQFDGDDINVGVRYLQERGVIKLLSEPTLVTLSGRPATFVAGGEFAVPTIVGSVGLNAVTTDFRSFGAIISFLPTIVDKDRIRLQVAPEFSQLNRQLQVNNTPGLNVRAATTTVEMREGQTLAIAGLLEDSYTATTAGNLPGLAKLFGKRDTSRSETELIILVTPELVHPMEPEEVPPLPGFDVTEPTACQFFFHGDIEGNPTQDNRLTVWPRLRKRYGMGGPAMTSGPFGHGQ